MRKISIYLHFPFCIRKCNYCDFVSYPCLGSVEDFSEVYIREIELYSRFVGRRKVSSIYFGGGTPSLMRAEWIEKIIQKIYALFDVESDCEITLEVNPKTVDEKKIKDFFIAGINRLSLGIQSFDDEELKFLGRVHSAKDALDTLDFSRKYFDNISCDFIYALPFQTLEKWQKNLDNIISLGLNHLSLYQLIVEAKTPLYKWVKDGTVLPIDEKIALSMFEYTNKILKNIIPQYEISNYARKGFESRHNLNYWNGGDYLGIGVSASGRIFDGKKFFISENPINLDAWIKNVSRETLSVKPLRKSARARELLIMGLRKNSGIKFSEFNKNSLISFDEIVDMEKVLNLVKQKFLILSKSGIRLSVRGRNLLDAILREIIK